MDAKEEEAVVVVVVQVPFQFPAEGAVGEWARCVRASIEATNPTSNKKRRTVCVVKLVGDLVARAKGLVQYLRDAVAAAGVQWEPDPEVERDLSVAVRGVEMTRRAHADIVGTAPRAHARVAALVQLLTTSALAQLLGGRWLDLRTCLVSDALYNSSDDDRHYLRAFQSCAAGEDVDHRVRGAVTAPLMVTQHALATDPDGELVLAQNDDVLTAVLAVRSGAAETHVLSDKACFCDVAVLGRPATGAPIPFCTFAEATELATSQLVVHPSVFPVCQLSAPRTRLFLRALRAPDADAAARVTEVGCDDDERAGGCSAVLMRCDVVVLKVQEVGMWGSIGFLSRVFDVCAAAGISVGFISTSETTVVLSLDNVHEPSDERVTRCHRALQETCACEVIYPCFSVSLIGQPDSPAFDACVADKLLVSKAGVNKTLIAVGDERAAIAALEAATTPRNK